MIDEEIRNSTNQIQSTVDSRTYTPSRKKNRNQLLNEINEKNRHWRKWQHTRDPQLKRRLNNKIKFIKCILATNKQDDWDSFLDQMDTRDGSIYKLNKCLFDKPPAAHPFTGQDGFVFSSEDKAELFADSLENQFTLKPGLTDFEGY